MTASTDIIIFLVSFLVIYVSIQAPESIMYTPINDSFDVRLLKIVLIIYRRLYDIIYIKYWCTEDVMLHKLYDSFIMIQLEDCIISTLRIICLNRIKSGNRKNPYIEKWGPLCYTWTPTIWYTDCFCYTTLYTLTVYFQFSWIVYFSSPLSLTQKAYSSSRKKTVYFQSGPYTL